jgi:hypothetical protein
MVSLAMVMGNEFPNRSPQLVLPKQNHAIQTGLLDAADKPFRVAIQVRRSWRQSYGFIFGDIALSQSSQSLKSRRHSVRGILSLQVQVFEIRISRFSMRGQPEPVGAQVLRND